MSTSRSSRYPIVTRHPGKDFKLGRYKGMHEPNVGVSAFIEFG